MFGFLAPAALLGLTLLSVPILLHIFKPRKVRQTPFSSLRWLRASQHRISRRIKWHQVLLFALRAAFITLLVLALAKPIWSPRANRQAVHRIVVLDVGHTMGYVNEDGRTPMQQARELAQLLVSQTAAGDQATVMLAGNQVRALGPLVSDASVYVRSLQTVTPEAGSMQLTDALPLLGPMLSQQESQQAIELFFITDNSVNKWSQSEVARFLQNRPEPVSVHVLEVGPQSPQNSWIAEARLLHMPDGRRFIRVRVASVGLDGEQRSVQLSGLAGLADQSQEVQLQGSRPATVVFEIPSDYPMAGKVGRLELLPGDALAADDVHWVNLDATGALNVLVIEEDLTQIAELQPGFHLRTAIDALADAMPGSIQLQRGTPDALLGPTIAEADLIVLVDVPSMPAPNVQAIEERVRAGAGLAVFVGSEADPTFYNSTLREVTQSDQALLPAEIGSVVALQGAQGGLAQIANIDWSHPLFSRLFDPVYGDLNQVRFTAHRALKVNEKAGSARVLAEIGGVGPVVLENRYGLGHVLLFNTTASDAWSDLPRRKSFVPLIDRMLEFLAGAAGRASFGLGETVIVPVNSQATKVVVTTPGGSSLSPLVRTVAGRSVVQLDRLTEPGVYQVEETSPAGTRQFPLVLQPASSDSVLARMDEPTLRQWWSPAEFEFLRPTPGQEVAELVDVRLPLEPWLIALACLMLLGEMYFVHRLCPQMNPAVVSQSVISARGSFVQMSAGSSAAADAQRS